MESEEIEGAKIRSLLDECLHQITFLQKSQESLKEALIECPDDEDFLLAVSENNDVIQSKGVKIAGLQKTLLRVDAAYREERRSTAQQQGVESLEELHAPIQLDDDEDLFPVDEVVRRYNEEVRQRPPLNIQGLTHMSGSHRDREGSETVTITSNRVTELEDLSTPRLDDVAEVDDDRSTPTDPSDSGIYL
mmetsp:Transcript_32451/g.30938  ORF Transcript_32451/g.30938 Transcript_32451/m.30938 type:complete len:191 (-) Transcript_32451:212-784(-)|eukprot:CAMPEP_0119034172 /NCGR_PEP_ID=MMETSP1177-20130426/1196_1 /TAXON_ID=2985 /ORGANISM="Ochromonas sp, Strain CCMP1899" /LENGTH=190 /DNA_ID=CAMNT_0006991435 /DNA_START=63 /DNA_END=635 /DNA_ORIENTATION=+